MSRWWIVEGATHPVRTLKKDGQIGHTFTVEEAMKFLREAPKFASAWANGKRTDLKGACLAYAFQRSEGTAFYRVYLPDEEAVFRMDCASLEVAKQEADAALKKAGYILADCEEP